MGLPAAIIDLDNTLLESDETYLSVKDRVFNLFLETGLEISSEQFETEFAGRNLLSQRRGNTVLSGYAAIFKEIFMAYHGPDSHAELFAQIDALCDAIYTSSMAVVDGAYTFLEELQSRGYLLICYTLGDATIQHRRLYDHSSLGEYFNYVEVVSEKTVERLSELLVSLFLRPEECFYFGDSLYNDAMPATTLGIRTFIRRTRMNVADHFPESVILVRNPRDIIAYLD